MGNSISRQNSDEVAMASENFLAPEDVLTPDFKGDPDLPPEGSHGILTERGLFNILLTVVNPTKQTYVRDAATALLTLLPNIGFGPGPGGDQRLVLVRDGILEVARQIPHMHAAQLRLVALILELHKTATFGRRYIFEEVRPLQRAKHYLRTGPSQVPGRPHLSSISHQNRSSPTCRAFSTTLVTTCSSMSFLSAIPAMVSEHPDGCMHAECGSDDEDDNTRLARSLNYQAFMARLLSAGFMPDASMNHAIWTLRGMLEQAPVPHDTVWCYSYRAGCAATWFIYAGQAMHIHVVQSADSLDPSDARRWRPGEMFKGSRAFGRERWAFWRNSFSRVKEREGIEDWCVSLAEKAVLMMDAIDQVMQF
jgi:hypothetical protein